MAEVSEVHVRVHGWCDTCGGTGLDGGEIVHKDRNAVALTEPERGFLAMHARYESERQDDFRYWNPDPTERARLKARWREIADALHTDPWGTGS